MGPDWAQDKTFWKGKIVYKASISAINELKGLGNFSTIYMIFVASTRKSQDTIYPIQIFGIQHGG